MFFNWRTTVIGGLLILCVFGLAALLIWQGEKISLTEVVTVLALALAAAGFVLTKDGAVTGLPKCVIPLLLIPGLLVGGVGCNGMTQSERLEMLVATQTAVVQTLQAAFEIYAANEALRAELGEIEFQQRLLERQAQLQEQMVYLEFLLDLLAEKRADAPDKIVVSESCPNAAYLPRQLYAAVGGDAL